MNTCQHVWVAGMMYVHDEDAAAVAAVRPVVCESCDTTYSDTQQPTNEPPTAPYLCLLKGCQMVKDGIQHYPHCPTCGDTHRIVSGIPGRVIGGTWISGAVQHHCRACGSLLQHRPT